MLRPQPLVAPPVLAGAPVPREEGILTVRGMRGMGGGRTAVVDASREYRATTRQSCGFWPFVAGSGTPLVGAHMGRRIDTGTVMHCDPIAWFEQANRLSSPSMFTLALNGLGKSTIQRHMMVGLDYRGIIPWVPADTKGEYVDIIRALGGAVMGPGTLNPLDLGAMGDVAASLTGTARVKLMEQARNRRSNMVAALIGMARELPVTGDEKGLIDRAITLLADTNLGRPAILEDLAQLLAEGPEELRVMQLARTDEEWLNAVHPLRVSLQTVIHGRLGPLFNGQTSQRFPIDRPVCVDLSQYRDAGDPMVEGAIMLMCWAEGFATLGAADARAQARGEQPPHHYMVLDELWRILRAGVGLVDRVDELTRLNRTIGAGQSMTTHSMADLAALRAEEDRAKAKGFVERSGIVVCGGLPETELDALDGIVDFTDRERQDIISWSETAPLNEETQQLEAPPGRGKFLIKVKGQPGIPVQVVLTTPELHLNDTNARWANSPGRRLTVAP